MNLRNPEPPSLSHLQRSWISAWARVFVALTLLPPPAAAGSMELLPPIEEFPPTSADLNGVAVAPSGDYILVGDGPTVIHRTTDPENNPIWTSLDAWAAGFFSAEVFTVELAGVGYPGGDGWVLGGRETLVETDFLTTLVVDQRPGSGSIFTPVLSTSDAIWYGVPDLGINPSFLHRYDRANQTAPGIAFSVGAVLAMCELPSGDLRIVTTDGDISDVDDSLTVTPIHQQPPGESLELNSASFSEDCEVITAGDATSQSRIYAGFVAAIPPEGPSFTPWRFRSRTGEPAVTASSILTPQEQGNIVGLFAILLRCDDNVPTGDNATMSAYADFLESRILDVEIFNEQQKCMRDGAQAPADPLRSEGTLVLPETADFEMLTVGTQGRVQRIQGSRAIHFDDFESGDLSLWSAVTP